MITTSPLSWTMGPLYSSDEPIGLRELGANELLGAEIQEKSGICVHCGGENTYSLDDSCHDHRRMALVFPITNHGSKIEYLLC